jgi:hypothetical protein
MCSLISSSGTKRFNQITHCSLANKLLFINVWEFCSEQCSEVLAKVFSCSANNIVKVNCITCINYLNPKEHKFGYKRRKMEFVISLQCHLFAYVQVTVMQCFFLTSNRSTTLPFIWKRFMFIVMWAHNVSMCVLVLCYQ